MLVAKKEIKKIKYNNSIGDNSKKYTKQNLHKNKKDGEKKYIIII